MLRLKELRKSRKITQEKLAEKLGLARSTITMYETGGSEPDLETLKALADFFDVTVDYLLGKDSQSNEPSTNSKTNTIIVYGRGQGKTEYEVTEKELNAIKTLLETMKDLPDEDNF